MAQPAQNMYNLAMAKRALFGYNWDRHEKVSPALLSALRVTRPMAGMRTRVRHPFWALDYTQNQKLRVRVGSARSRWRTRPPGTAHLYPPETTYWEHAEEKKNATLQSAYITFEAGEAAELSLLVDTRTRHARFIDEGGILWRQMEDIAREGGAHKDEGYWRAQAMFFDLIDLLHRSEPVGKGVRRISESLPEPEESEFVRSVHEYLARHLAEPVTLEKVAKHLHVSPSTLSHRYHRETGNSPVGKLIRMRIDLARALIIRGNPLQAVADSTGFSDAFHLSKTFKRLEGVSPRGFLQGMRRRGRARL
jgi:AraC-like DNA-binding protein